MIEASETVWNSFYQKKDSNAREKLIIHYLPLVKMHALRIIKLLPSHIIVDDLISSGITGLVKAIEKFNPHQGTSFSTFASSRIFGSIMDDFRTLDWVPRSIRHKAKEIQTAYNSVEQKLGRDASDLEVAAHLNLDLQSFHKLLISTQSHLCLSLDSQSSYSNHTYKDNLADPNSSHPLTSLLLEEKKKELTEALMALPKKERLSVILYYFHELTLKEIAEVLEITESRVSQIHSKAIYRLKAKLNMKKVMRDAPH